MQKLAARAEGPRSQEPRPREPGLREQGKTERLRRLHQAALEVFRARGYDAATTREIAQVAGVAVGTVFVYAKDKRDLLFLVVNDDLDAVLRRAVPAAAGPAPLLDQLMALLSPIYGYFAAEPVLARALLLEVLPHGPDGEPGEQAERFTRRIDAWMRALATVLGRAKRAGELRLDAPATVMARILWDLHLAEVRRWMTDAPVAATGRAQLRRLYAVVLDGRLPGPAVRGAADGRRLPAAPPAAPMEEQA